MESRKTIDEVIREICPPDESARIQAEARWNKVAKPLGSLGLFENMITRIAALRGQADFSLKKKTLLVFCADNGVVAQGVSQCGSEVTGKVAVALAEGRSTANTMARQGRLPRDPGGCGNPGLSETSRRAEPAGAKRYGRHQPGSGHDKRRLPRRHDRGGCPDGRTDPGGDGAAGGGRRWASATPRPQRRFPRRSWT